MTDSAFPPTRASRRDLNRMLLGLAGCGLLGQGARAAATASGDADAARYPEKPIRLIVPFTPGGSTDILGRTIGQQLTQAWQQPVIIENVPGAGGSIGADRVAKSRADGYTLLMGHIGTLAVTPSLYRQLPYDPLNAFAAVAWVARVPNVLVVHPSLPVRTLQEFVAYAQAHPREINYGSGGNGSAAHITTEYLKLKSGISLTHVPYKGTAPAVTDLLGGQIQLMFTGVPAVWAQIKAGQIRALAVSSPQRIPLLSDVPTVAESGYPGFDADQWYGIVAPAGTPAAIIDKLNTQINQDLGSTAIRQRLESEGAQATPQPPQVFASLITREILRWRTVIQESGMSTE
ncbi:MAG: tripartite tricarboxylate transporter substrate binding protein [Comamonas sp.]